jgi:predicted DCC family thiol-disulfide oxidoreductase YuxK
MLVYDADCGFCTKSAFWLGKGKRIKIISWQALPSLAAHGLTVEMVTEAAYWLEDDRPPVAAQGAIAASLIARGAMTRPLGWLINSRPVAPLASWVYRLVARNRHKMPGGTAACAVPRR